MYYFNKDLKKLKLHECALLTAILPSPGGFNPFSKTQKALQRRNIILKKMQEQEIISEEEWNEARLKTLPLPAEPLLRLLTLYRLWIKN